MVYTGFRELRGPDADGRERKTIVFELMPIEAFDETVLSGDKALEEELWQQPLESLRERAIASSSSAKTPAERIALVRYRSNSVRIYVLILLSVQDAINPGPVGQTFQCLFVGRHVFEPAFCLKGGRVE